MQNAKANKTCRGRKLTNTLVRKPGAGDRHARFDERDLETEHLGATAPDLDSTCAVKRAPDPVGGRYPTREELRHPEAVGA
jgi:hypothetical protein